MQNIFKFQTYNVSYCLTDISIEEKKNKAIIIDGVVFPIYFHSYTSFS